MKSPGSGSREQAPKTRQQLIIMDCCLLVAIAVGMVMVIFRSAILPERFMGDEGTIQELAQGLWSADGDSSYSQVSMLYRVLGLADNALLAGLFGYILSCIPYILVATKYRTNGGNIYATISLTIGVLLSSIYMGSYSKEVFIIPVVLAIILARPNILGSILICGLIVLYAANFRSYWFLVLILFVFFSLAIKRTSSGWRLFALGITVAFVGSFIFSLVMGVPSDHFRLAVNVQRASLGDVNTLIPRFVELSSLLDGPINNALSFVFLQFPIPLLIKMSPYYFVLFIVFSVLWVNMYKCIGKIGSLPAGELKPRLTRVAFFIVAFAITQAFFEPDYGSALKHLTPFLPLFLMMYLGSSDNSTDTPNKKGSKTLEFSY